jgi:hypothetical protein
MKFGPTRNAHQGRKFVLLVLADKYPDRRENDLVQLYQTREVAVKRHEKERMNDRSKMSKVGIAGRKEKTQFGKQRR